MAYKNLINSRNILVAIFLLIANVVYAQNCKISRVDSFRFKQTGLIGKMYNGIKSCKDFCYQVMLVRSFAQMLKKEAFYIAINPDRKFKITAVVNDSVILSKDLLNTNKYNIGFIENNNMAGGELLSECRNVISSHKMYLLLFFDSSVNKWIEYTSMDGHMLESLNENKEYAFLKQLYELVALVFKDAKVYREE